MKLREIKVGETYCVAPPSHGYTVAKVKVMSIAAGRVMYEHVAPNGDVEKIRVHAWRHKPGSDGSCTPGMVRSTWAAYMAEARNLDHLKRVKKHAADERKRKAQVKKLSAYGAESSGCGRVYIPSRHVPKLLRDLGLDS